MEKYLHAMRDVAGVKDYEYSIANKMFLSKDIKTRECMEQFLKDELEKVDFADPAAALEHINQWVENITKGQVRDLVPADAVGVDSSLILVSYVNQLCGFDPGFLWVFCCGNGLRCVASYPN